MTEYPPVTAAYPMASDDSPQLKDKATDAAEAAKQAGAEVAQTATEKAKDVAHETSKQARDLVGEARAQVRQQAGTQHRNLVDNLRSLGDELGGMTAGSEQSGVATEAVGQIRDRVHGAADWLERREPGDLVDELRSFARRRPGAFLLGAVAVGVVAGRLTRGVVAVHADDATATKSEFASPTSQNDPAMRPAIAPATTPQAAGGYPADGPGYAMPGGYGAPPDYGRQPGYGTQPRYGTQPTYGAQPVNGDQFGAPPATGYPQAGSPENGEGWR
ncbi:MAG: hypothetical protein JWP07_2614 [Pseudonocardiales bacterium]|nr:hypothetical protein [Pseudonocardiales bacterium]